MRPDAVLFIQYERDLPDGRIVVSGPSFGGAWFHWTSGNRGETKLVNLHDPAHAVTATLTCENPKLLSSAEQLGFDPFSTDYPLLRELQNYTSAILSVRKQTGSMLGLVMVPTHAEPRFLGCRMRLVLNQLEQGHSLLLEDIAQLPDEQEKLILRWANPTCNGFLLMPAKGLYSSPPTNAEATLILFHGSEDVSSGALFCLRPYRQKGSRTTEYREVRIGSCETLSAATEPTT